MLIARRRFARLLRSDPPFLSPGGSFSSVPVSPLFAIRAGRAHSLRIKPVDALNPPPALPGPPPCLHPAPPLQGSHTPAPLTTRARAHTHTHPLPSGNRIGDPGATSLAAALTALTALERLYLEYPLPPPNDGGGGGEGKRARARVRGVRSGAPGRSETERTVCVSLSDLSELRPALSSPSRTSHL